MNYNFIGKDSVVTDDIKRHTEDKLSKIEKFIPENTTANVRYIVNRNQNRIEVTIPINDRVLRAEVVEDDMYSAVDRVQEVLEKQIKRYKSRLRDRYRKEAEYKEEFNLMNLKEEIANEKSSEKDLHHIERVKKFIVKPTHPEDAIMEMDLIGHNFFVFLNHETDEINVVYKRKNGSYGLIEPEF